MASAIRSAASARTMPRCTYGLPLWVTIGRTPPQTLSGNRQRPGPPGWPPLRPPWPPYGRPCYSSGGGLAVASSMPRTRRSQRARTYSPAPRMPHGSQISVTRAGMPPSSTM